jgi:hypothetical protein
MQEIEPKKSQARGEVLRRRESGHVLETTKTPAVVQCFWDHPGRNRVSLLDLGWPGRGGREEIAGIAAIARDRRDRRIGKRGIAGGYNSIVN